VPDDPNIPYDMMGVVRKVVDDDTVFEIMPAFAPNIICAFARMNGHTVGVSKVHLHVIPLHIDIMQHSLLLFTLYSLQLMLLIGGGE